MKLLMLGHTIIGQHSVINVIGSDIGLMLVGILNFVKIVAKKKSIMLTVNSPLNAVYLEESTRLQIGIVLNG